MRGNTKDFAAGALFIVIGLFFGLYALFTLHMGTLHSMGPGYFPIILSSVLVLFGIVIVVGAIGKPAESFGHISWRGVVLVTASIVFFAATVRGLGMLPSMGLATFMAGMSSGRLSTSASAAVSACLTIFCVVLFVYALGLPYPVIGPWLYG